MYYFFLKHMYTFIQVYIVYISVFNILQGLEDKEPSSQTIAITFFCDPGTHTFSARMMWKMILRKINMNINIWRLALRFLYFGLIFS